MLFNVFRGRQGPAKGKEPSSGEEEETPCRGALAILSWSSCPNAKTAGKVNEVEIYFMFFISKVNSKLAQSNYFLQFCGERK